VGWSPQSDDALSIYESQRTPTFRSQVRQTLTDGRSRRRWRRPLRCFRASLTPPQAVVYCPIDEDAPRALIGLAHRRDDRSPAARNLSPPLGQCGRQIKAAAAVLRRCPKKITCSGFDRRGLPPGTSTVLPPCRLLTHRCRLGATHFCSRSEGKRTSGQHHATSQFDPCATSARRSQVTSAAQLPTSNTQVSPGTF
jgi:hypothetical protein